MTRTYCRIQVLRDGRYVAAGSLKFTETQGRRMLESSLYRNARLVEVGTGRVLFVKYDADTTSV